MTLRVAMIGQKTLPASYGGVETAVEELSAALAERGVDVVAYCSEEDGPLPPTHRGIRLLPIRQLSGKHLGKLTQAGLASVAAARGDFDIVHFHAIGPTVFAPIVSMFSRAGVVATIQGRDDQRAKWGPLAQRLLGRAAWLSARAPDEVIVVSKSLQENYLEDFGRRTHHISNGMPHVDPPGDESHLTDLGLEAGNYFLYIGRLVPEKACNELVAAFRNVTGDVRLAIVGDAAHTNDFVSDLKAAAAADPRITFTGPLYGPEKATVFANARAFVLPSHLEGLPLALLEASAYRLPVVVSDIPPHVEALGDSGPGRRMFPMGDVAALTAALQGIVDDVTDEKVGAELSGKSVEARHDWNDIADATLDVYTATVARRRSRLRWLRRKSR